MSGGRWRAAVVAAVVVVVVGLLVAVIAARSDSGGNGSGAAGPRSPMQLRLVLGEAPPASCAALRSNPRADAPVSLTHQGRCIGLSPSMLTVSRAGVSRPIPGSAPGQTRVQVNLLARDARTFSELTEEAVGRQLAVVAFGRVLLAAEVREPIRTGELEVSGLTAEEAEQLRTALR